MTLQPPPQQISNTKRKEPILCRKCGQPVIFRKDCVSFTGKKYPLNQETLEPHQVTRIYGVPAPSGTKIEQLITEWLRIVDLPKNTRTRSGHKIIGAVGRAS
jgi:hypothetical protein